MSGARGGSESVVVGKANIHEIGTGEYLVTMYLSIILSQLGVDSYNVVSFVS